MDFRIHERDSFVEEIGVAFSFACERLCNDFFLVSPPRVLCVMRFFVW